MHRRESIASFLESFGKLSKVQRQGFSYLVPTNAPSLQPIPTENTSPNSSNSFTAAIPKVVQTSSGVTPGRPPQHEHIEIVLDDLERDETHSGDDVKGREERPIPVHPPTILVPTTLAPKPVNPVYTLTKPIVITSTSHSNESSTSPNTTPLSTTPEYSRDGIYRRREAQIVPPMIPDVAMKKELPERMSAKVLNTRDPDFPAKSEYFNKSTSVPLLNSSSEPSSNKPAPHFHFTPPHSSATVQKKIGASRQTRLIDSDEQVLELIRKELDGSKERRIEELKEENEEQEDKGVTKNMVKKSGHGKFKKRTTKDLEEQEEERNYEESLIDENLKSDWKTPISASPPVSGENMILKFDEDTKTTSIEAGTFNELMRLLIVIPDPTFMKTFILTYKSFATPQIFLAKLMDIYQMPDECFQFAHPFFTNKNKQNNLLTSSHDNPSPALTAKPSTNPGLSKKGVEVRVVNILINWLTIAPFDWDPGMVQQLDILFNLINETNQILTKKMESKLSDLLEGVENKLNARTQYISPEPRFNKDLETLSGVDLLLAVDSVEMARQITLLDWSYYCKIMPSELLDGAWTKPKLQHRSKNVKKMIQNFNRRSNWAASFIVKTEKLKMRVKVWSKLIDIAQKLLELNNFSSTFAFYSAFENSACHRMKITKAAIQNKKNTLSQWMALHALADSSLNKKAYRDSYRAASPPIIPHLGVFLTDLIFIEDGNPSVINKNLINFKKRKLSYEIITSILQFQSEPYNFQDIPLISNFLDLKNYQEISDAELFKLSLISEPKEIT